MENFDKIKTNAVYLTLYVHRIVIGRVLSIQSFKVLSTIIDRDRYAPFIFIFSKYSNVHLRFPGLILSYFPPLKALPLTLESFPQ